MATTRFLIYMGSAKVELCDIGSLTTRYLLGGVAYKGLSRTTIVIFCDLDRHTKPQHM